MYGKSRFIKLMMIIIIMGQIYTVVIEQGEDGYLISEVIELPGRHTQAKTMDKLLERTKEAISLYLKCKIPSDTEVKFLGLQQIVFHNLVMQL